MYSWGYMYPRLGTAELTANTVGVKHLFEKRMNRDTAEKKWLKLPTFLLINNF